MHYSETFATDVRLPIIPIMKKLTRISEGENHTFLYKYLLHLLY